MTTTNRGLIAYIAVVILLSAASSLAFARVPRSELCSPPFLGRPGITEAVPCRPILPGLWLQLSIDVLVWSVGILLLIALVDRMRRFGLNWQRCSQWPSLHSVEAVAECKDPRICDEEALVLFRWTISEQHSALSSA
jgi:hypothetical protein